MEESVTYRNLVDRKLAEGRVEGEALGLRRAITNVVRARLGEVPADLEERLAGLDTDALDRLNTELACAADEAAFRALLERREG